MFVKKEIDVPHPQKFRRGYTTKHLQFTSMLVGDTMLLSSTRT